MCNGISKKDLLQVKKILTIDQHSTAYKVIEGYMGNNDINGCDFEIKKWWFHTVNGRVTIQLKLNFIKKMPINFILIANLKRSNNEWIIKEWKLRGGEKFQLRNDLPLRLLVDQLWFDEIKNLGLKNVIVEKLKPFPGLDNKTIIIAPASKVITRHINPTGEWVYGKVLKSKIGLNISVFTGNSPNLIVNEVLNGNGNFKGFKNIKFNLIDNIIFSDNEKNNLSNRIISKQTNNINQPSGNKMNLIRKVIKKKYEDLSSNPKIAQAVILSNFLSVDASYLAYKLRSRDPEILLQNINQFAKINIKHFLWMNEEFRENDPYSHSKNMFYGTIDDMFGYYPFFKQAVGWCGSIAHFYLTMLRMNGIKDEEVLEAYLGRHVLLFINIGVKSYLIENHNIRLWDKNQAHYLKNISMIANDSFALSNSGDFSGLFNNSKISKRFMNFWQHFSINSLKEDKDFKEIEKKIFSTNDFENPLDFYEHNYREIFENSQKGSEVCELALYSHQSLDVPYPQIYCLVSLEDTIIKVLYSRFSNLNEILNWIKLNLEVSTINQHNKVLLPNQLIRFRRGSLIDFAMFTFSILRKQGYKTSILIGTSSVYLKYSLEDENSISYCDMSKLITVQTKPSDIYMEFNDKDCYLF